MVLAVDDGPAEVGEVGAGMTSVVAIYRRMMTLECKGLCWGACGPVPATATERETIRRFAEEHAIPFVDLTRERSLGLLLDGLTGALSDDELRCPYLADRRCSIYQVRPMLCRLWGAVENMPCPFGCQPKGGLLAQREGHRIMDLERPPV